MLVSGSSHRRCGLGSGRSQQLERVGPQFAGDVVLNGAARSRGGHVNGCRWRRGDAEVDGPTQRSPRISAVRVAGRAPSAGEVKEIVADDRPAGFARTGCTAFVP